MTQSYAQHAPSEDDLLAHKALRISNAEGCVYMVMQGVSESFLGAMAVELGHRDTNLALLMTVPMLVGSLAQLAAGPLTALLGARKRLVVLGASLQTLSLLGLYLIAAHGVRALWPLLLANIAYYVCTMLVGPPWGAWMAALTEGRQRERFFARRAGMTQATLLVAFGAAGAALQSAGGNPSATLRVFSMLHLVGFVFRAISTGMLALQPDIERTTRTVRQSIAAVRMAGQTANFRVAGYLTALALSTHIAAPFFTPYMLRDLHLDYAAYVGLTAIPIVVRAICSSALHPLSERFGMRRLLVWSGGAVVILPALWVVFGDLPSLAVVQAVSGLAWGTVDFASYQLLLSSARAECRVEFLSIASTMGSGGQLVGGLAGGYLRGAPQLSYHALFLLSAVGRGLAMTWLVSELPSRLRRDLPQLFLRVISVRPENGTVQRPIVADAVDAAPDTQDGSGQDTAK